MPANALAVVFGFTLFKSYMTTLLFLAVTPLDISFYFLVLFQCVFKIAFGLGLKNCIHDRYCSSGKWKRTFETMAQKKMNRAMRVNFTIVAALSSKCSLIAIVLLEYIQVHSRESEATEGGRSGVGEVLVVWQPPFTAGFHQLERMSMAAGFFVQIAFHLVANDVVESILARKISRLKRELTTMAILKEATEKREDLVDGGRGRRSSMSDSGLGAHALFSTKIGEKWRWSEHRASFFQQNWVVFVVWSVYLTMECVTTAIQVRSV